MSSSKKDSKELTNGWVLCSSKSTPGRKYYFNRRTGKSTWADQGADNSTAVNNPTTKIVEKKKSTQSKTTKRKSDGDISRSPQKKKRKEVTATPDKNASSSSNCTPSRSKLSKLHTKQVHNEKFREAKTSTPSTPLEHTKNLASNRLAKLQGRLSSELQGKECSSSENVSNKNKTILTTPQADTIQILKADIVSPDRKEPKFSNSQSPGSDNLTAQSPSQFLTANKIISSMKAHLTEEYADKECPKNTFADIEEGISKKKTEYPFMNHPSTPPQFSEANKLVSAIKSKLTYKALGTNEGDIVIYRKAEDRMAALRARLSKEAEESDNSRSSLNYSCNDNSYDDSMEVEVKQESKIIPYQAQPKSPVAEQETPEAVVESDEDVVLVVDTNIFIHELDIAKDIASSHLQGYSKPPTLLVPWRVINELDRLKDNNNGNGSLSKRAKAAMDYLYKSLPHNNRIKGQSLRDSNSHIYPCESPDDEILNCCLQQAERGKVVIMVSNDKNLCSKTVINGIRSISLNDLRPLLWNRPRDNECPASPSMLIYWEDTMYTLLSNILENEMRAKYDKLWLHVLFKPPPWTLLDVLQCLLKHWIAVFSEVFPRIEHTLTDLSRSLKSLQNKAPKSVSEYEASNFHELCLDVAKKCQIIPEYMDLAKQTVEALQKNWDSTANEEQSQNGGENIVIEAFEGLWTVFSSYCAKLATQLGVAHDLEDKLPNDEKVHVLYTKCDFFIEHISELTTALRGVCEDTSVAVLQNLQEVISRGIKLELVETRKVPSVAQLSAFVGNSRNMLFEAGAKFSRLLELLEVCKQNFNTD